MNNQANTKSGRLTLVLIAALFIGPLAIAWTLYMSDLWRPGAGANYGTLIEPVITLPRAAQPAVDNGSQEAGYLQGKWTLVHLISGGCDAACEQALLKTRQVRLALGKYVDRIQRIAYVADNSASISQSVHPELSTLSLDGPAGRQILQALEKHGGSQRLFVVDPLANLILSYPIGVEPAHIRDDLKRLLRVSRIGQSRSTETTGQRLAVLY